MTRESTGPTGVGSKTRGRRNSEATKTGRPAGGQVKWLRDVKTRAFCWHARFTLNGKRTKFTPLDPRIPEHDEVAARECARSSFEYLRSGRAVPKVAIETVREWFARLHAGKEGRGLATVKDMRGRATRWVFPVFGDKDIHAVNREDGEKLVARLDTAVAAFLKLGPGQGRLAPSSRSRTRGNRTWLVASPRGSVRAAPRERVGTSRRRRSSPPTYRRTWMGVAASSACSSDLPSPMARGARDRFRSAGFSCAVQGALGPNVSRGSSLRR